MNRKIHHATMFFIGDFLIVFMMMVVYFTKDSSDRVDGLLTKTPSLSSKGFQLFVGTLIYSTSDYISRETSSPFYSSFG